jgi:acetyl-CoA decarbonylase/synthase complex subunit delta
MPFKRTPQKFNASVKEVVIGTGDKAVTLGGESVYSLYSFDGEIKNPPKIGVEISDKGPNKDLSGIAAFYAGTNSVADAAKKACTMPGASFIVLSLESSDPNGDNKGGEDCVALCKEVAAAVTLPLAIIGSKNVEKDATLLSKVAEALEGKNVLLLSAREDNHKQIAVSAIQAYSQTISAESSVDLNLAKQLNVLITQLGIKDDTGTPKNTVMNLGSAAAGYGFEYVATTFERVKTTALDQKDVTLQVPVVTPVAAEAWGVKESVVSEADADAGWGPQEQRGIDMEISTAVAAITSGSNAVILRHPRSVEVVSQFIADII